MIAFLNFFSAILGFNEIFWFWEVDFFLVVRRSATPEVAYHDQLDGPPREASGPAPDLQADFPRFLVFLLIGITTIFLVQIHLLSTEFNLMVLLAAYSLLHQARQVAAGQENWLAEWRTVLGIIHR